MFFSFLSFQELRERVFRGKYRIPFYMSTDCETLLKKFLVLNPTRRAALDVKNFFYVLVFLFIDEFSFLIQGYYER